MLPTYRVPYTTTKQMRTRPAPRCGTPPMTTRKAIFTKSPLQNVASAPSSRFSMSGLRPGDAEPKNTDWRAKHLSLPVRAIAQNQGDSLRPPAPMSLRKGSCPSAVCLLSYASDKDILGEFSSDGEGEGDETTYSLVLVEDKVFHQKGKEIEPDEVEMEEPDPIPDVDASPPVSPQNYEPHPSRNSPRPVIRKRHMVRIHKLAIWRKHRSKNEQESELARSTNNKGRKSSKQSTGNNSSSNQPKKLASQRVSRTKLANLYQTQQRWSQKNVAEIDQEIKRLKQIKAKKLQQTPA